MKLKKQQMRERRVLCCRESEKEPIDADSPSSGSECEDRWMKEGWKDQKRRGPGSGYILLFNTGR